MANVRMMRKHMTQAQMKKMMKRVKKMGKMMGTTKGGRRKRK